MRPALTTLDRRDAPASLGGMAVADSIPVPRTGPAVAVEATAGVDAVYVGVVRQAVEDAPYPVRWVAEVNRVPVRVVAGPVTDEPEYREWAGVPLYDNARGVSFGVSRPVVVVASGPLNSVAETALHELAHSYDSQAGVSARPDWQAVLAENPLGGHYATPAEGLAEWCGRLWAGWYVPEMARNYLTRVFGW